MFFYKLNPESKQTLKSEVNQDPETPEIPALTTTPLSDGGCTCLLDLWPNKWCNGVIQRNVSWRRRWLFLFSFPFPAFQHLSLPLFSENQETTSVAMRAPLTHIHLSLTKWLM